MVITIEQAKQTALTLNLEPNRPNLRRIARAYDLLDRDHIRLQADFGAEKVYHAISQTDYSKLYTVLRNGKTKCTCIDAEKGNRCKHGLAAELKELQEAQAKAKAAQQAVDDEFSNFMKIDQMNWKQSYGQSLC